MTITFPLRPYPERGRRPEEESAIPSSRQSVAVFALSVSDTANQAAKRALHFAYYNSCRIHNSLRVTPATEAGI